MSPPSRQKRTPRPLDAARLDELALAYVARFAASGAKLESYLQRKLRERGWGGDAAPDVAAIVARFVQAGYIDDAGYARMKAGSLRRRGYGERRIGQALGAAGIAEELREEVRADEGAQRLAALAYARRRRLGPFGPELDRAGREKQLAALLRAGHRIDHARALVQAGDIARAEEWAGEGSAGPAVEEDDP
ncbi:MAG TPA: RecX family transcriptional regulator [Novosphingobium sp.]|nr:RecX family transcriptional regulator [Novosphingobium sp.]